MSSNQIFTLDDFLNDILSEKREEILKINLERVHAKKREKEFKQPTQTYTQNDFRNDVCCLEDVKSRLGNQYFSRFQKTGPLLHFLDLIASKDENVVLERQISTISERMLNEYKLHKKVMFQIKNLIELDVLKQTTFDYCSGLFTGRDGKVRKSKKDPESYSYIISRKQINFLKEIYIQLYGYEPRYENKYPNHKQPYNVEEMHELAKKLKIKDFGSCRITYNKSCRDLVNDAVIESVMTKNKSFAQEKLHRERLNQNLPERARGHYEISITSTNYSINKIGIRDWNMYCNMKSHEEENEEKTNKLKFYDEVRNDFKWKRIYQFDVTSSVPNTIYFCQNCKEFDGDFYKYVFGREFKDDKQRDDFKTLCLFAMFSRSESEFINHILLRYTDAEKVTIRTLKCQDSNSQTIEEICSSIYQKINDVLGNNIIGTNVFQIESEMYMYVEDYLQSLNIQYVRKFDAFYSNDSLLKNEEVMKLIVKWSRLQWLNKYGFENDNVNQNIKFVNIYKQIMDVDKKIKELVYQHYRTPELLIIKDNDNNVTEVRSIDGVCGTSLNQHDYDKTMELFYKQLNIDKTSHSEDNGINTNIQTDENGIMLL